MSINKSKKAGLGEIFAAMSGITEAAITVVNLGESSRSHPLSALSYNASFLQSDAKIALIATTFAEKFTKNTAILQDQWAKKCLSFLADSVTTLGAHSETRLSKPHSKTLGGSCADLCSHIQDMIARENDATERHIVPIKVGGRPIDSVDMPYLAGAAKYTGGDDQPAPKKKRGRPPKARTQQRQMDFV